jgi:hypothetical protein
MLLCMKGHPGEVWMFVRYERSLFNFETFGYKTCEE